MGRPSPTPDLTRGYDLALADRLARERRERGDDRLFYMRASWRHLREEILRESHGECHDCRKRGELSTVLDEDTTMVVHHVLPVEDYPGFALSRFWYDTSGKRHEQLVALCNDCHERRHGRAAGCTRDGREPVTEERW